MRKDNRLRKTINNVINKLERSLFINNHKSTDKDFTNELIWFIENLSFKNSVCS
jgi:hypothetical protein